MDSDWNPSLDSNSSTQFDRDRHVRFLEMMYQLLPSEYQGQEINRLTLAYFVISGLHMLDAADRIDREGAINWVLSLKAQVKNESDLINGQFYGFHGSRSSQFQLDDNAAWIPNGSHLASTYCALAILKTLDYDLTLLDSESILKSMKNLQQPDGCFMPIHTGAERDLRFIFCAAAICSMLENWSGMDKEKAKEYILNCQSYDGGFGLIPGSESHACWVECDCMLRFVLGSLTSLKFHVLPTGSPCQLLDSILMLTYGNCFSGTGGGTYCAVASLRLMGFIEPDVLSKGASPCIINVPLLLDWSLQRQAVDGGFQGRANKSTDTCYAFWVGSVLSILGGHKFIDEKALRQFLLTCQSKYGGFSKFPGQLPDLYHTYYGFSAFSLLQEPGLNPICVELGITDGC
ncbi:hypothetical protein RHMOL_Rhmol09G0223700 [Rhododendron molle]|uniref:Uncharacterized protein n=1 Tax=Rhododendron molle TaxID=49168 RepID=A0ACC0MHC5_RHOML|nr:hypothetical protein RHMOL_Rhmol09G0223700 [Rhododendron molle]